MDFLSLHHYKDIYGHLMVPQAFGFEKDRILEGGNQAAKLGAHVKYIRKLVKTKPGFLLRKDRKELDKMGFVWDVIRTKFDMLLCGVDNYRKLYGNCVIPCSFVVPKEDAAWDKVLWGFKLGQNYRNTRASMKTTGNGTSAKKSEIMKKVGIANDGNQILKGEKMELALSTYKALHVKDTTNSFTVPRTFTVPEGDQQWPLSVWGLKLGLAVQAVRYRGQYAEFVGKFREIGLKTERMKAIVTDNDTDK